MGYLGLTLAAKMLAYQLLLFSLLLAVLTMSNHDSIGNKLAHLCTFSSVKAMTSVQEMSLEVKRMRMMWK